MVIRKRSGYPVGATWVAKDKHGDKITVTLQSIEETFEHWGWYFNYSDGSCKICDSGWYTTKRLAVEDARSRMMFLTHTSKIPNLKRQRIKQEVKDDQEG